MSSQTNNTDDDTIDNTDRDNLPVSSNEDSPPHYYLNPMSGEYWLLQSRRIDTLLRPLLGRVLGYHPADHNHGDELVSMTMTQNEVSVVLRTAEAQGPHGPDEDPVAKRYESLGLANPLDELEIHIDGPYFASRLDTAYPGRDEAGILAPVTQLLASKKVPLLCLSTFSHNYILCPTDHREEFNQIIANDSRFSVD